MTDDKQPTAQELATQADAEAKARLESIMRKPKAGRPVRPAGVTPEWLKNTPPSKKPKRALTARREVTAMTTNQRWRLARQFAADKLAAEAARPMR